MAEPPEHPPRRRRRAVGPAGAAAPGAEPRPEPFEPPPADRGDDDARLTADRPPHHDRGV